MKNKNSEIYSKEGQYPKTFNKMLCEGKQK